MISRQSPSSSSLFFNRLGNWSLVINHFFSSLLSIDHFIPFMHVFRHFNRHMRPLMTRFTKFTGGQWCITFIINIVSEVVRFLIKYYDRSWWYLINIIYGHFAVYLFASWVYLRKTQSKLPFYYTEETLALHKQTKSLLEEHGQITHFERFAFLETNMYICHPINWIFL